jgi:hypothetical protein
MWGRASNALNTKIQTHEATIEGLKSQQKSGCSLPVAQNSSTLVYTISSHALVSHSALNVNHGAASHSAINVNPAMESLRVALLTDQLRVKYDLDVEKWNEASNALNTENQTHEATIEGLKSQQKSGCSLPVASRHPQQQDQDTRGDRWRQQEEGMVTEKAVNNQELCGIAVEATDR